MSQGLAATPSLSVNAALRLHPVLAGLLVLSMLMLLGLAHAPAAAQAPGASGQLRYLSRLPEAGGPHSATQLEDGSLLLYGSRLGWNATPGEASFSLRQRQVGHVTQAAPWVWDAPRRRWLRLPAPPQCGQRHILATATLLADDQVLIAGGLCEPESGNASPAQPAHTQLILWDGRQRQWLKAPAMSTPRLLHSATRLSDDSVMLVGGQTDPHAMPEGREPVLASVERYADGELKPMPALHQARALHSATALADKGLLVVGGRDAQGRALASVERWDADQEAWVKLPPLATARYGHNAVMLANGRVMVSGGVGPSGQALASVEIFDPTQGSWSASPPMLLPLQGHDAALLKDGSVLVAGGRGLGADGLATPCLAMLRDANSAQWAPAGHCHQSESGPLRSAQIQVLALPDGSARLLGQGHLQHWAPASGAAGPHPIYPARELAGVTALADGRLLISGGRVSWVAVDAVELYDPRSGLFSQGPRLPQPRFGHSSLLLADGSVLLAGGQVRNPADVTRSQSHTPLLWRPDGASWQSLEGIRLEASDRIHMRQLGTGQVLFIVSRESGPALSWQAWLWEPSSQRLSSLNMPLTPRARAAVAMYADGTVIVAGGFSRSAAAPQPCPATRWQEEDPLSVCTQGSMNTLDAPEASAQLWHMPSGGMMDLPALPAAPGDSPLSLTQRNGDAVIAQFSSAHRSAPVPVWRWQAASRRWLTLPALPAGADAPGRSRSLQDLPDGSLLSGLLRLAPGASAWQATDSALNPANAQLVERHSEDAPQAYSRQPPYVASLNTISGRWAARLPVQGAPGWLSQPALVALNDTHLLAVAELDYHQNAGATAMIWHRPSQTWQHAGRLSHNYHQAQLLRLVSGQVLIVGQSADAAGVFCELWNPKTLGWQPCGSLAVNPGAGASIGVLGLLADGSAALISDAQSVQVLRLASLSWERWPLRLLADAQIGPQGFMVKPAAQAYASAQDPFTTQWVDASELASRYRSQTQPTSLNLRWDNAQQAWAYVLPSLQGLDPLSQASLPDGCALSVRTPRLFNPHTGRVQSLTLPDLPPTLREGALAVMPDGTVVLARPPAPEEPPENGFFYRQASCAGFAGVAADALLTPALMEEFNQASAAQPVPGLGIAPATGGSWNQRQLWTLLGLVLGGLALGFVGWALWRQLRQHQQKRRAADAGGTATTNANTNAWQDTQPIAPSATTTVAAKTASATPSLPMAPKP